MMCDNCDHNEHTDTCMVSIGLPGDYQPCGCRPTGRTVYGIRPHRPMTAQQQELARRLAEETEPSEALLAELRATSIAPHQRG